jgi:FdhD protein
LVFLQEEEVRVTSKPVNYRQYKPGQWEVVEGGVIVEKPVSLTVNTEVWMVFMCTPLDLEALALGFLFNENVIQSYDDVASIRVCPKKDNIDVWLNFPVENPKTWRRTSGCTGGVTSTDPETDQTLIHTELTLNPNHIRELVEELFESQRLYREVGGVHTSALSDGNCILCSTEDIGRHNTLDKIAGLCLINNIWPKNRVLITTGRISSEMIQKTSRLGAPVIISRTSPSSLSIELAERWGITLIGYARRSHFSVYSHPERIKPYNFEEKVSQSFQKEFE